MTIVLESAERPDDDRSHTFVRAAFEECPACAAKPGSPPLCVECLERRELFSMREDAAKGGRVEHPTPDHAQSVVTQLESLLVDVGEGETGRRDVVSRVRLLLEDVAKYRAAVELAKDVQTMARVSWSTWRAHPGPSGFVEACALAVARHVLSLDGTPPGPETLDKSRVVEVLRQHNACEDVGPAAFDEGWGDCVTSIANDLGLTLEAPTDGGGK